MGTTAGIFIRSFRQWHPLYKTAVFLNIIMYKIEFGFAVYSLRER